ncbi:hypothetical protein [Puia sp.]|jgi:hypothetical protein|uniref:hypothetical protein n=1 Tax=Puia sp. TaxID=2045100 RepID=UPI002F416FC6
MKQTIPVKRLEYFIPETAAPNSNMTNVNIDFEKGNLSLEGDSQLMVTDTGRSRLARSTFSKGRIKVNAQIFPGVKVHLSDISNGELVFSLEGKLEDGKSINSCSGLLVLNNKADSKEQGIEKWHLAVYLYDDFNERREIKLILTMHYVKENAELN